MKKFSIILMLFAVTVILFHFCSKYDEGPGLSLRTKTSRITGIWDVEKVTITYKAKEDEEENKEFVKLVNSAKDSLGIISFTLERDGTGEVNFPHKTDWDDVPGLDAWETYIYDLEWKFSDDKSEFLYRITSGIYKTTEWDEFTIIRLTNSEFWIQHDCMVGGDNLLAERKYKKL